MIKMNVSVNLTSGSNPDIDMESDYYNVAFRAKHFTSQVCICLVVFYNFYTCFLTLIFKHWTVICNYIKVEITIELYVTCHISKLTLIRYSP